MKFIPLHNKNYGFAPSENIKGHIKEKKLLNDLPRCFAITDDFSYIAKNHCAATALTNLMLIYNKGIDCNKVFRDIHRFVKNGPVFKLDICAERYFQSEGIPVSCTAYKRTFDNNSVNELKMIAMDAINMGNPCALLIAADLINWHWVLCVGYIQTDTDTLLIIEDNWHRSDLYLYKPDEASMLRKVVTFTSRHL